MSTANKAMQALKEEAAARRADNEAAARQESMRGKPPVIPLGEEGTANVYYSAAYGKTYRLKPNEHTPRHLLRMATLADYAGWLEPDLSPDAVEQMEGNLMKRAARRLLEDTGGRQYDPAALRGRGVWRDEEGIIYNAGNRCHLVRPDGCMEQVDGVRGGKVYQAGRPLRHPAAEPLTDAEGRGLVELMEARPWVMPYSGELLAGWVACAVLAGLLPFRPHIWVNAPAQTGKSALKRDILRALGGAGEGEAVDGAHAVEMEGGNTTPAAAYQLVGSDALPVVFDEAESTGERPARNMAALLDILRSAATSGNVGMTKGGADGTARSYMFRFCALLFSIANNLDREADTSRFLVLRLTPPGDDTQRAEIWARQEEGRALTQGVGYAGRLLARLLQSAPEMLDNAKAIQRHLMASGSNPRRAELLGHLMAGFYALTMRGPVGAEQLDHAAKVAQAMEESDERMSDAQRCLDCLLGYSVPWDGGKMTVARLCKVAKDATGPDSREKPDNTLQALGMRWRDDLSVLQVNHAAPGIKEVFRGTDWANGKILPILAPGPRGQKSELGICQKQAKTEVGSRYVIMIPADLVLAAANGD